MSIHRTEHDLWHEFRGALGTNYPVSEALEAMLRREIAAAQPMIAELGREIAIAPKENAALLKQRRSELKKQLLLFRQVISPARRCPLEILSMVFSYCTDPVCVLPPHTDSDGFRWRLGHVCSSWRSAVRSTSRLWSRLEITVPPDNKDDGTDDVATVDPTFIGMVEEALSRTGQVPINIDIQVPQFEGYWDTSLTEKALGDILRHYTGRFVTVTMNPAMTFLDLVDAPWTSLDVATLDFQHISIPENRRVLSQAKNLTAPVLRRLTLYSGPDVHGLGLFRIQAPNLTRLDLEHTGLCFPHDYGVLKSLPRLREFFCLIDATSDDQEVPESYPDVCLGSLQKFSICMNGDALQLRILRPLVLPALTGLVLRVVDEDSTWFVDPEVLSMLRRSKCVLDDFYASNALDLDEELENLLTLQPDITALTVLDPDGLPASVVEKIASGEFLPKLRHLSFMPRDGGEELVEMLERRTLPSLSSNGCLATLDVVHLDDSSTPWWNEYEERIDALEEAGLLIGQVDDFHDRIPGSPTLSAHGYQSGLGSGEEEESIDEERQIELSRMLADFISLHLYTAIQVNGS